MRSTILGMGQWLPDVVLTNDGWPKDFRKRASAPSSGGELAQIITGDDDRYEKILQRRASLDESDPFRGTLRRRVADESMTSSEAEALAGKAALADAGVAAKDVDLVISWAMVPDRLSPANAPKVAYLVGAKRAGAIAVEAACASAVVQMQIAAAFIESGRARTVLLTQSHLIMRANPLSHPASPLLGDAATAFVMGASDRPGFVSAKVVSDGAYYDAVTWVRGKDHDPPWWREGGPFVAGSRDPAMTKLLLRGWVRYAAETIGELLGETHTSPEAVDVIAAVQPRAWLPGAICEAFNLPDEKAPHTHADLAHVGGCGVVTNLIEARRRGMLKTGTKVLVYGMGAGVTQAAALLDWA